VYWIDADDPPEAMLHGVRQSRHEQVVLGSLDEVIGVLRKQDLFDLHLDGKLLRDGGDGSAALLAALREPLVVHDGATVVQVLETFKNRPVQMALIVDEYGALRGLSRRPTSSGRQQADSTEARATQPRSALAGKLIKALHWRHPDSIWTHTPTP
jgi:hypothetical protein